AAITKNICHAEQSFVCELEGKQAGKLKVELKDRAVVYEHDFFYMVNSFTGFSKETFIYADPPYLKEVRRDKRNLYKVEWDVEDHEYFLNWVREREELIMITHPVCALYEEALPLWNRIEYKYKTRVGMLDDCIWINYEVPIRLHDYSYAGSDRTERQRIKRKIGRVISKLATLPGIERNAVMDAIDKNFK
ncbi:MAG TPA: hypothetical protein VGM38_10525, partial [Pseudolysinimonas sp.]